MPIHLGDEMPPQARALQSQIHIQSHCKHACNTRFSGPHDRGINPVSAIKGIGVEVAM